MAKKNKVSQSYDQNFNLEKYVFDRSYRDSKNIENQNIINRNPFRQESFNLSENMDYLTGDENPHTYQGGMDIYSNDPFEELRAQRQSGWTQAALIAPRTSVKIISEVAKIPGYLAGIPMAIGQTKADGIEAMTNNSWIRSINELNEKINTEFLPVYTTKAVKEGNLWDNITSTAFWATEGADGIGFMASMLVPGAILKSVGLGSSLYKGSLKGLSLMNKGSQYAKIAQAARQAQQLGLTSSKFDVGVATLANTYLEAAAEAGSAVESFESQKPQFINNLIRQGYSPEQAEQAFETQKGELGVNMMVGNAALLLIPNAIQSSMIWGKNASKFITKAPTIKESLKARGKNLLGASFSEGVIEEAGQSTMENFYGDKASKNQLKPGLLNDSDPKGLVNAYLNTISSVDGQKAMFLGAFLGGGMSIYSGHKEDKQNLKNSQKVNELIAPYHETLKSILETDNYKRDENGEIIYTQNNKPVLDKANVLRKMKTLDKLSHNYDAFDQAMLSGDTETIEKLRDHSIREMVIEYAKHGEMGVDALKTHLEEMSKAEDIQELGDPQELAKRKESILKYAKEVSSKFENYVEVADNMFNITNPNATTEQKKTFFNALSQSYGLREIEREQIKDKLKNIDKNLKVFEYVDNFSSMDIDEMDKKREEHKNKLSENKTYLKLNNQKQQLEENLNKINSIIEDYFNEDSLNDSFNQMFKSTIEAEKQNISVEDTTETSTETKTSEEEFIERPDVEDMMETDDINQVLTTLQNLDNFKSLEEFDKYQSKINSKIKKPIQDVIEKTREDLKRKLEEDNLNKESEEIEFKNDLDLNPTPEDFVENNTNTLEGGTISTIVGSKEVNENFDIVENSPLEVVTDKLDQPRIDSGKNGGTSVIGSNKDGNPVADPFKAMYDYEQDPRDKTKDDVQFGLGDIKDKTVQDILTKIKNSEIISEREKKILIDNLPISVTLTSPDKSKTSKSFINAKVIVKDSYKAKEYEEAYNNNDRPLREKIVEALIENKGDFSTIKGKVIKQYKGKIMLDTVETKTNLLNSSIFKGMSEKEAIEYFKNNTYYTNYKGQLVSTKTGEVTEEFNSSLNSQSKGDVFIIVTRPNGSKFPLKLNNARISEEKSKAVVELVKIISKASKDESFKEKFNSFNDLKTALTEILPSNYVDYFNSELKVLESYEEGQQTLENLLKLVIHTQNNNNVTKFFIDRNGNLILGDLIRRVDKEFAEAYSQYQDKTGFTTYTQKSLEDLSPVHLEALAKYITYKKGNILIKLTEEDTGLFNNDEYIKHLLGLNNNEPVLVTNATKDGNLFSGYTNIVLAHEVFNNKPQPKTKNAKIPVQEEVVYDAPIVTTEQSNAFGNNPNIENKPQQSDIEAKKADIEKRRQEELEKNIGFGNPFISEEENNFELEERNKDTNAKYDAELAALENNSENISEKEWNDFVDNNNVSERILNIIANKIINNESFSIKEQAIHSSNVSKIENILNNIRNSQENSVSLQEELDNLNKERRSLIRMLSIEGNETKLQKVEDRIKEIKSKLGLIENKPVTEAISTLNNVSELTPKQKSKYIVEAYKMLNLTLKPEQLKNIDETFNSVKTQIESAGLTAEINKKCNL